MSNQIKYIAYYRVSTQKQGNSGLGLEAQKEACKQHAKGEIVKEYTEIESGKNANRIELNKALSECEKTGSTLLIAKLDRLSRDVVFIFNLQGKGIKFVCCDFPEFNTLTLGIFAALAQYERELISKRTKDALQAKKARGEKLGGFTHIDRTVSQKASVAARNEKRAESDQTILKTITCYRRKKLSFREIANMLNESEIVTQSGAKWYHTTVANFCNRNGIEKS